MPDQLPVPEKLVIQGNRRLNGVVHIAGAKNSVLKLMAAALLTPQKVIITNVPQLSDVTVMLEVLRQLGCKAEQDGSRLSIDASELTSHTAPYEFVRKMRASFNVLGGLLGRLGQAKVSLPGGCSIGKRNIDLHVKGLIALGADVEISHGYVEASAKKLIGAEILLDTPSVGATENIMLAAVLAEGVTTISNAAQEPEIVDLANFLNTIGADISGSGTNEIVINGVNPSQMRGTEYPVMPDRIEAATYLIAGAAAGGKVTVENVIPAHIASLTHKLVEMGAEITSPTPNSLCIEVTKRLIAQNIVTQPYPGFPTDLQAPFMTLLTLADGVSIVKETIYENRFKQVGELKRMGADIQVERDVAVINGVEQLSGAQVNAHDLRAGAAMVIAGLMAQGQTEIYDLIHLDRGYEFLVEKLQGIGAEITRVPSDRALTPSDELVG
ncbi:MAG: UDP-N-acetylglucosamine 1-carboxyvinyltransferase [Vampirovibrionales bacterium]|nr:UDP-N-acetylglucosamine 1-carboxyvinyltransferase [Vampirovibrionales bacterium]